MAIWCSKSKGVNFRRVENIDETAMDNMIKASQNIY